MSYRDYPDARLYDDRDIYGPSVYDRSAVKRVRSPSPYDHDEAYRLWAAKRARSREDYGASPAYGGAASPPRTRAWDELDREEKEREWARYEREQEWERYRAREYEADVSDPYRDREGPYRPDHDERYRGYADYDRARDPEPQRERGAAGPKPKPMDPMESPSIVPFRKYAQILRELGTEPCALATGPEATQELYDKYQEYRVAHLRKTMLQFWETHKSDKWFVEKYGLEEAETQRRNARRKRGRQGRKKVWLEELREGKLDKVCWDAKDEAGSSLVTTTRLGEEETLEGGETVNVGPEQNQVMVRQIPPEIGREELEEALQDETGFQYLALGEPHPSKRWSRVGWAQFDSDDLQETVERLNQKTIAGQKLTFEIANRPAQAKLKLAPQFASSMKRLAHDLQQAKDLVALLAKEDVQVLWMDETADEALSVDASAAIEQRCREADMSVEDSEGEESEARRLALKKALDLHLDLLREVYNCDYYSSLICDFPEELSRRSPKHLRRTSGTREEAVGGEKSWASNLDGKHKLLMRPNDNEIGELGGTALDKVMMEFAAPFSREDGEEKHLCTVVLSAGKECGKPFKAQLFVQKHVLNKHRDFINGIAKDKADDVRYFNSYVRDPQRVMPPLPTMNGREAANGNGAGNPLSTRIGNYDGAGGPSGGAGGYYGASGLIRMGGLSSAGPGGVQKDHRGAALHLRRGVDEPAPPSLGMRIGKGPVKAMNSEPLPSNPRPLDPRAAHAPKRYEDLDAGGGPESGEIELEY